MPASRKASGSSGDCGPRSVWIPDSLSVALLVDSGIENDALREAGVERGGSRRRGRGRQVELICPTRRAVVAVAAELLYRWEERYGYDPEVRPECNLAGRVGERIARANGIRPDELPSYCYLAARERIR